MKFTRRASAHWKGSGKEGSGTLSTQSSALNNTPYSFHTRFENKVGTNPEELVGAAHAGCFTMQLSFLLGEEGHTPDQLQTAAQVTFEDGAITHILLDLTGEVPGLSANDFERIARKAKEVCPVSKLLKAEIELKTTLK